MPARAFCHPWRLLRRGGTFLCVTVIGMCLLAAGCARPTGDFGRAAPARLNDSALPVIGRYLTLGRGEAVSGFPVSDGERRLYDLGWSLVQAPWLPLPDARQNAAPSLEKWQEGMRAELKRHRILRQFLYLYPAEDYVEALEREEFQADAAWFQRIIVHIDGDLATIRPFCEQAVRIAQFDAQRVAMLQESHPMQGLDLLQNAIVRQEENRIFMRWVRQSVNTRLRAYHAAARAGAARHRAPALEVRLSQKLAQMSLLIRQLQGSCGTRGAVWI